MEKHSRRSNWLIPIIILIASVIISGAYLFTKGGLGNKNNTANANLALLQRVEEQQAKAGVVRPVSADDHIFGNPNAPIKIIQYADTACPYCGQFMGTMKTVMNVYGKPGKVAWIYRHLPDEKMHPSSAKEAEAAECVGEIGGNEKFWEYVELLMDQVPSNSTGSMSPNTNSDFAKIAESVGIDRTHLNSCLANGKVKDRVKRDKEEAIKAGATATPFVVIITPSGERFSFEGARPYVLVKQVIDSILAGHGGMSM